MKIISVNTKLVDIPCRTLATSYRDPLSHKRHTLVAIEADNRITGLGEASPLTYFTGETPESVQLAITDFFAEFLVGQDPFDLEKIHAWMNRFYPRNTTAKAALDMALLDIAGKSLQVPVFKLLGGRNMDRIPLARGIGIQEIDQTVKETTTAVAAGFQTLKLKIGRDPARDIAALTEVRNAVGDAINLRVDANQGYDPKSAVALIRKLAPLNIQYVEQPVDARDLVGLAHVRNSVEVPIAADESLQGLTEALDMIRLDAVDVFVIKLIKVGGIYPAKKIVALAEAANKRCVMVSPYEIGIGAAAGAHLAMSSTTFTMACEFLDPSFRPEEPTTGLHIENGWLQVSTQTGLGVAFRDGQDPFAKKERKID
jgi:o-succinylbenzoate synthase